MNTQAPYEGPRNAQQRLLVTGATGKQAGAAARPMEIEMASTNTLVTIEAKPEPGDIVISKPRYSGFYGTDLEMILRSLGIQYLVFTGCTTSVCVESTMRDAMFRDYTCLLLADCTAEPIGQGLSRSNHDASLLVLQTLFGWISESAQFIGALESQPAVSHR